MGPPRPPVSVTTYSCIDLSRGQLVMREAKGDKDRAVPLPVSLREAIAGQIEWRASLHRRDLGCVLGRVDLPHAFEHKSPRSAYDLGWQFVFASERISQCPRTSRPGRYHLHENALGFGSQSGRRLCRIAKESDLSHPLLEETKR